MPIGEVEEEEEEEEEGGTDAAHRDEVLKGDTWARSIFR